MRGRALRVRVVIDAHGSWERGPEFRVPGTASVRRAHTLRIRSACVQSNIPRHTLAGGLLPVFAFDGGYGGMVVTDCARTTVACCIRRDSLEKCRRLSPGLSAGVAVEAYLKYSFRVLFDALQNSTRDGAWFSVGPVRPGLKSSSSDPTLRVGNAVGETHPLVGEGIGMALSRPCYWSIASPGNP